MSEMFLPQFRHDTIISPEEKESDQLQKRMIDVMRFKPKDKQERKENDLQRKDLKEEYMTQYPDQMEGIEVIFGMKRFVSISNRLSSKGQEIPWKEKMDMLRDLTEYQYLITHYILEAGKSQGGRKFLRNFWQLGETIAHNAGLLEQFMGIKKGVLGQVASYKIMEKLDYNPKLSHPNLDAFYSVDLLTEDNMAIQVKTDSSQEPKVLEIRDTEEAGVPTVVYNKKGEKIFVNERHSQALNRFKINLQKLSEETGETYSGKEFIIPIRMIDENTGEPNRAAVDFFEKELGRNSDRDEKYGISLVA